MPCKEKDLQDVKRNLVHQARKMQQAQSRPKYVANMGFLGGYGWYLGVPFALGIVLGMWANCLWPGTFSYVLVGGITGLLIGLVNANFWLWCEGKKLQKRKDKC